MDRDQAITHLRDLGFEVFERSWALGDTIGVGALPAQHDGVRVLKVLEYLYPQGESGWAVTDFSNRGRETLHEDLASAVDAIIALMRERIAELDAQ